MNTRQRLMNIVEGAVNIVRKEATDFTRKGKIAYSGVDDDLVTSADTKAQAWYVEKLHQEFPEYGLIGEEDGLNDVRSKYFTIDPVDGTKAFARRQSHGVGSMLAMVDDGEVIAALIADVNTGDVYGFADGGPMVRKRFGVETEMVIDPTKDLHTMYISLDNPHHWYHPRVAQMVMPHQDGGLFKNYDIMGGSIGTSMARLWKDEIALMVLMPSFETPWDSTPLIGINKKLGIVHVKVDPVTGRGEVYSPHLPKKVEKRDYIEILVHESRAQKVLDCLRG